MQSSGANHGRRPGLALVWFALAGVAVWAFYTAGRQYAGYQLVSAGVGSVPGPELVFYAWYSLYGLIATVCFALAWRETQVPDRLLASILSAEKNSDRWILIAATILILSAVLFRHLVLLNEPVADDELTYRFIAQTLLEGRVVNEPPIPHGFLTNQFVIVTQEHWFGKYPIGHPLVLAVGELAHLRGVVIPMLCGASLALTFAIGRMLFSARVALVGALLLLVSPQFVFTAATELSQPTETFFILLGTWCLLLSSEDSRWRWVLIGACAWGMSVLVRPLPGVVCVLIAGIAFMDLVRRTEAKKRRARYLQLAAATLIIAGISAILLVTNSAQSGDAMVSGYHRIHGAALPIDTRIELWPLSFFGALLRQNFWAFGVPMSLLLVPCARPRRGRLLFWGLIAAVYSYRLIAPKTVVATTGPVYVAEVMPFAALATAAGLAALARLFTKLELRRARESVIAIVLAAFSVSLLIFVPVQIENIHRGSYARARVLRLLEAYGDPLPAVVFGGSLVDPAKLETWAYHPPSPDPSLNDEVIFLRLPPGPGGAAEAIKLWEKEMPERRAFVWNPARHPNQPLIELPRSQAAPTSSP